MTSDGDLQEMLKALQKDYRRSLPATLERIETAWTAMAKGSADAACVKSLERALHSIAGAAGTFGMPALGDAAAAAEAFTARYVEQGAIPAGGALDELDALLEAVRTEAGSSGMT